MTMGMMYANVSTKTVVPSTIKDFRDTILDQLADIWADGKKVFVVEGIKCNFIVKGVEKFIIVFSNLDDVGEYIAKLPKNQYFDLTIYGGDDSTSYIHGKWDSRSGFTTENNSYYKIPINRLICRFAENNSCDVAFVVE